MATNRTTKRGAFRALRRAVSDASDRRGAVNDERVQAAVKRAERLAQARLKAIRGLKKKLTECRKKNLKTRKLLIEAAAAIRGDQDVAYGLKIVIEKERLATRQAQALLRVILSRIEQDKFFPEQNADDIRQLLGINPVRKDGPVGGLLAKLR